MNQRGGYGGLKPHLSSTVRHANWTGRFSRESKPTGMRCVASLIREEEIIIVAVALGHRSSVY